MSTDVRTCAPVLLTYSAAGERDEWARVMVRGETSSTTEADTHPTLRRVILQGSAEADRVWAAIANGRYHRGVLMGGASIMALETAISRGEVKFDGRSLQDGGGEIRGGSQ